MIIKSLKEIVRIVIKERSLNSEAIVEVVDLLHSIEFLAIKVLMFALSLYHLYVYTVKTIHF
ncbi:hypothetical protein FTO70_10100 [Methanosarcina sp. KYL-1]|uniref:hypothetical protein n=1 Tax=Methanosarcina sp. KYL-1 TaxID=2602068 RepID=UPI00210072AB|nr:hypothetical protein [Methanosarcina sp. KYL-1]MCQ1536025.1 hypothetical protein [Methanosarcina sp. KYL-1]